MKDILHTWESELRRILQDMYPRSPADGPEPPLGALTVDPRFGHLTTSLPLRLAKILKKPPRQIAEEVKARLSTFPDLREIKIEGPGHVNVTLSPACFSRCLSAILKEDKYFGRTEFGKAVKVLMEYCSANPTGPMHIAHGRQAAVGDSLANIMSSAGFEVTREFYLNDAGNQIANLGHSILWRYHESFSKPYSADPTNFYHGDYIKDLARELAEQHGDRLLSAEDALETARAFGVNRLLARIKQDLQDFQVPFDSWYSQDALERSGKVESLLEYYRSWGITYEKDGAVWLKTTSFGDPEDRVLIKRDGTTTYRTPDLAYHRDKYERGFDIVVNLLGPDHHGHIITLQAGLKAMNMNILPFMEYLAHRSEPVQTPETRLLGFEAVMIQHCRLMSQGQEVKMSKRSGTFVTLRDLMEEVGRDVTRYFFAMRKAETHLDFDLDLAKKQSMDNPVYYVQYAHARIESIFRKCRDEGKLPSTLPEKIDPAYLGPDEIELISAAARFPLAVEDAARNLDTQRMTNYLYELSGRFQSYYQKGDKDHTYRVLCEDSDTRLARLAVCRAIQTVLRNGLALLGVSAPERMEKQAE